MFELTVFFNIEKIGVVFKTWSKLRIKWNFELTVFELAMPDLYKDLLCYLCLCGLVVSFLSLTQEILGSKPTMLIFYFIFFVTEFSEFSENI